MSFDKQRGLIWEEPQNLILFTLEWGKMPSDNSERCYNLLWEEQVISMFQSRTMEDSHVSDFPASFVRRSSSLCFLSYLFKNTGRQLLQKRFFILVHKNRGCTFPVLFQNFTKCQYLGNKKSQRSSAGGKMTIISVPFQILKQLFWKIHKYVKTYFFRKMKNGNNFLGCHLQIC